MRAALCFPSLLTAPIYCTRVLWLTAIYVKVGCKNVTLRLTHFLWNIQGQRRLGGSALAQAYRQIGSDCPDVDMASVKAAFETTQTLLKSGRIVSGHDISDGGAVVALLEMAFAGVAGIKVRACLICWL